MDARGARALIRDEGRLRTALTEHEKRRFDVDTALTVKCRVEDLLETVGLIAQDDDFWNRLTNINRPASLQQLDRVKQLDPLVFAALLEAAGYDSPPPPPVEELIDDTIRALIAAVTTFADTNPNQVGGARWQLRTLVIRVRHQIKQQEVPELAPSILRSSARSRGRAARWLIPRVVAATAGGLVETHAPGSGLGLLAWRAVQRTTEDLGQLATEMVIGDPSPAPETIGTAEPQWTEIDPLDVHIAALMDELYVSSSPEAPDVPIQHVRQAVSEAHRHLNRVEELVYDSSASKDIDLIERKIQTLREKLNTLSLMVSPGEQTRSSRVQDAIDLATGLQKLFGHHATPPPREDTRDPVFAERPIPNPRPILRRRHPPDARLFPRRPPPDA
jgi:hypothetical protein